MGRESGTFLQLHAPFVFASLLQSISNPHTHAGSSNQARRKAYRYFMMMGSMLLVVVADLSLLRRFKGKSLG
jgi:hypothetical protein